jgi:hypothetical protein
MTSHQVDLDASARADDPARDASRDDGTLEIASDLAYRRLAIVNVVFSGQPGARDQDWALIDAGLFRTKGFDPEPPRSIGLVQACDPRQSFSLTGISTM